MAGSQNDSKKSNKKLTPEQYKQAVIEIYKEALLTRLERKGLITRKKTLH
jgi:hypothetical protein